MRKKRAPGATDDTKISAPIIEQAKRAVLRRVKVDRSYDVPYLAGYSEDGKTIYIDCDLPKTFDLHIPPDLDLEPYQDEHDAPLLRRMRRDSRRNHHKRRRR